jgi:nicotinate-nucleotide adenylyltransferase
MRIGLLGGSFDPVHKGHIAIAKEALRTLGIDWFYFIPTKNNPWKDECVASADDRINMLKIALQDDQRLRISPIEIDASGNGKSYTVDTLANLCAMYPTNEYYYLMGMDQVCEFDKWKEADTIASFVQLVAFNRKGYPTSHKNLDKYHFIKMGNTGIEASSTQIKEGHLEMLDHEVLKYISSHGLYLDTMIKPRLSKKRYNHSLSVAKLTKQFAQANGCDPLKGWIAGVMHDVAKEMDKKEAEFLMREYYPHHMEASRPIWHQWLSSYVCQTEFLIMDPEILKAIEDHTTGSTTMTKLGKCLYCADKLDPLRGYDSSKGIALCMEDIDAGFASQLEQFYQYSKEKKRPIDDVFFEIYNKYVKG